MMKILLFSLALALTLTACGQKGALYLPEKSPAPPHSTPTQGEPVDMPVSTDSNDY
ncbi:lipoprotein [Moraxella bovis]|uniref:LPS translocon maturation chaperone LptM n=1 Tax=Moraxella bovis TaxID=476 RepID=UPI002225C134|nr:lipoprotein [Moraxella bovis]UYZ76499.1 lipoprotein [Moraxella bovis]